MQSAITRRFVLPIVMLGFLAVVPMAYAVVTNHSGAICSNYSPGEATLIERNPNGIKSIKASGTTGIVCPLTRNTSNSNGAWVYVDVTHIFGTQTTTCSAYSHNYMGQLLAVESQTWPGSGFHEFQFNLTGLNKSDTWSDYSVFCTIAGNGNVKINGVDLNEQ